MTHFFTDPNALCFLKYLNLVNAANDKGNVVNLSEPEIRVLNTLALSWRARQPRTVKQAVSANTWCCTSSTHRILPKLRQKKSVEFQPCQLDNRFKYLLPTAATPARRHSDEFHRIENATGHRCLV